MSRRGMPRFGWRTGRLIVLMGIMLALTVAGLYQVWARYQIVQLGYAIDAERFEHRRLLEQKKRLRLSLATYEDPRAVKAFAREHLDMRVATERDELIVPTADQVEAVPTGRSLGGRGLFEAVDEAVKPDGLAEESWSP